MSLLCLMGWHGGRWGEPFEKGKVVRQRRTCSRCGAVSYRMIEDKRPVPYQPPRRPRPGDPDYLASIDG